MALKIHWIPDLDAVLEPTVRWLEERPAGAGLFDPDMVVVPTEGTRAWLSSELAVRNGARDGFPDGVVARVEFLHPGALRRLLVPSTDRRKDPWSVDRLTVAVLPFLSRFPELDSRCQRAGGPLLFARRIADRFDHYHTRRPEMIRSWASGEPLLTPCIADGPHGTQCVPESDRWQFELWRMVREAIGDASPPETVADALARIHRGERPRHLPSRLLVAGLQSLSASTLEILDALSGVCDIDGYLVHPSPVLAARWDSGLGPEPTAKGVLPSRIPATESDPDFDPLPVAWLQGSRELQCVLHAFGLRPEPGFARISASTRTLLGQVQSAVRHGVAAAHAPRSISDNSLRIHRCHSLSRQVEVLHDALLHAFRDLPGLQPHEVVILSPRIQEAAPLLEAVFDRDVAVEGDRTVRLPLVVADRSLRRVSEGASFLADLLDLLLGRCDLDALGKVALSPLVLRAAGLGGDVVSVWDRVTERTRVAWGLDAEHRAAHGLVAPGVEAHTWWQALERSLLGALLPDSEPEYELGDVVPLTDLDPEELPAVTALVRIVAEIAQLEAGTRNGSIPVERPIPEWCDRLATTLGVLCGADCDAIRPALEVLDRFRGACQSLSDPASPPDSWPVTFAEFATMASEALEGNPGRAPLRTGHITATSLVPLRGVPFRVVCLLGIDDGTFGAAEAGGDDLAGMQKLVGDRDPRVDSRRQFLDAVLCAREQVIVTCDGRSIVNNQQVPLTTALAEFADFVNRVAPRSDEKLSALEREHPRHSVSAGNFQADTVVAGRAWSHDTRARGLCRVVGRPTEEKPVSAETLGRDIRPIVALESWDRLVRDPLDVLAREVLGLRLYEEQADPDRALLPLKMDRRPRKTLTEAVFNEPSPAARDHRLEIARRVGELPVGAFADRAADDVRAYADGMRGLCDTLDLSSTEPPLLAVQWQFDGDRQLVGTIPGVQEGSDRLRVVDFQFDDPKDLRSVGLRLLVLAVLGHPVRHAMRINPDSKSKNKAVARLVFLDPSINVEEAANRLTLLDELHRRASVRPYAFFGETVETMFEGREYPDRELGREPFAKFLNESRNQWRNELRLFGSDARFDSVFDDDAMDFWTDFHRVMRLKSVNKDECWVKDAPRTKVRLS